MNWKMIESDLCYQAIKIYLTPNDLEDLVDAGMYELPLSILFRWRLLLSDNDMRFLSGDFRGKCVNIPRVNQTYPYHPNHAA